jgi:hypothetical protein
MVVREWAMVTCHLDGLLQERALALEPAGVLKLSRGFLRSVRRETLSPAKESTLH